MISILSLNLAVIALYLAAFVIQVNLLAPYDYLPGVSLLFLPHGIRVLAVLIGRAYAIPGLFVGSLLVSIQLFSDSSLKALSASVLSALMPYVALRIVEAFRGGRILTESLDLTSVSLFIFVSAVLNAIAHTGIFMAFDSGLLTTVTDTLVSMVQGDVGGGLLLIALLWIVLKTTTWLIIPTALTSVAARNRFEVSVLEQIGLVAGALMLTFYLSVSMQGMGPAPQLTYFFLPMVVKVLAVLRFRVLGAVGIFLGGLAVNPVPVDMPLYPVWLAGACAVAGYISLLLWEQLSAPFRFKPVAQVVGFTVLFSLISGCLHMFFYTGYGVIAATEMERSFLVFVIGASTPVLVCVVPVLWIITRLRALA